PVDTDFFQPAGNDITREAQRFALVVSALVPYKRVDLAIEACRLARVPLTIAGDGPERARLARMATADRGAGARGGSDVTLVGRPCDRRAIRAHAERFSRGRFVAEMSAIIASTASGGPGPAQ